MNLNRPTIYLFTDGAASGNPGPGGFGVVLKCGDHVKELSEGFKLTTNNRMELLAVIKGIAAIKWDKANIEVYSDSKYVVDAITKGWLNNWSKKQFAKTKNLDLWINFIALYQKHNITFHWLKGHDGHPENERCDTLAVLAGGEAYKNGVKLPTDVGFEYTDDLTQAIKLEVANDVTSKGYIDYDRISQLIKEYYQNPPK